MLLPWMTLIIQHYLYALILVGYLPIFIPPFHQRNQNGVCSPFSWNVNRTTSRELEKIILLTFLFSGLFKNNMSSCRNLLALPKLYENLSCCKSLLTIWVARAVLSDSHGNGPARMATVFLGHRSRRGGSVAWGIWASRWQWLPVEFMRPAPALIDNSLLPELANASIESGVKLQYLACVTTAKENSKDLEK